MDALPARADRQITMGKDRMEVSSIRQEPPL
jgi:hypothetical protein